MNALELIFMACLSVGPSSDCMRQMSACAEKKKDDVVQAYIKDQNAKKNTSDLVLKNQPQTDWAGWIQDCAKERKPK